MPNKFPDEVIILAGGLGTRLKKVVNDCPKALAPIQNTPFLHYILHYLEKQGIKKVILATGYQHERIFEDIGTCFNSLTIDYSVEEYPLGTGGALKKALTKIKNCEHVFIINGDSFFNINLVEMNNTHRLNDADLTIALKPKRNISRYGTIQVSRDRIIEFAEKQPLNEGIINGGFYLMRVNIFENKPLGEVFSFEIDFMQKFFHESRFYGYISNEYFIDIGIPEDYQLAQKELPQLL
nr:nucleotidyltransferase family protein [Neobacillus sp. Marseille-Q6967]